MDASECECVCEYNSARTYKGPAERVPRLYLIKSHERITPPPPTTTVAAYMYIILSLLLCGVWKRAVTFTIIAIISHVQAERFIFIKHTYIYRERTGLWCAAGFGCKLGARIPKIKYSRRSIDIRVVICTVKFLTTAAHDSRHFTE